MPGGGLVHGARVSAVYLVATEIYSRGPGAGERSDTFGALEATP